MLVELRKASASPRVSEAPPHASQQAAQRKQLQSWFVCKQCGERIARESWQLPHDSQAPLVFTNPLGACFELVLVSQVLGMLFVGSPTTEFSWFPGFAWSVGLCGGCRAHLGWRFVPTTMGLREFFALSREAVRIAPGSDM